MLEVEWERGTGWCAPRIVPYHPLALDPSASVLHYALECFEGFKAYRGVDGKIRLFRSEMNMARFNTSAARMTLPTCNEDELLKLIGELIRVDRDWVPRAYGWSLYVRPVMIATEAHIGLLAPGRALLYVILSPMAPWGKCLKLYADEIRVRAFPGGTGAYKVGGNYAASILPQKEAVEKGFTSVLWLYGEDRVVQEGGGMNQFFLWMDDNGERELVTAPLDGMVLPGITRDSVLQIARRWGECRVSERQYTMSEVMRRLQANQMLEAFGTGTAVAILAVQSLGYEGKVHEIPNRNSNDPSTALGNFAHRIFRELQQIQFGQTDAYGSWTRVVWEPQPPLHIMEGGMKALHEGVTGALHQAVEGVAQALGSVRTEESRA